MTCGIYKITNTINNNAYIGYSSNIERRWSDHRTKPFSSTRKDDLEKVLYVAIRKHGLENFNFEIIEQCPRENLKEREIFWIAHYNTFGGRNHYNTTPGGDGVDENKVAKGEQHGMACLTDLDVVYCRECYQKGLRSRDIYDSNYSTIITYSGFLGMWHGKTWQHVMPEVFSINPHRAKYGEADRDILVQLFKESGMSLSKFSKTKNCYVGYGTIHRMINEPSFYDGK